MILQAAICDFNSKVLFIFLHHVYQGQSGDNGTNRNIRLNPTDDLTDAIKQFLLKHAPSNVGAAEAMAMAVQDSDAEIRDLFLDLRKTYGVMPAWKGLRRIFAKTDCNSNNGSNANTSSTNLDVTGTLQFKIDVLCSVQRRLLQTYPTVSKFYVVYNKNHVNTCQMQNTVPEQYSIIVLIIAVA